MQHRQVDTNGTCLSLTSVCKGVWAGVKNPSIYPKSQSGDLPVVVQGYCLRVTSTRACCEFINKSQTGTATRGHVRC